MTMLQVHAAALDKVSTSYHEFLLRYKAHARVVYGLVEGKEDPMFYRGQIEHNLPNGWEVELIRSGNKEDVLKAFEIFDWSRFSPKRVCFFVDRDLSEFFPDKPQSADNLYVTDNYSIENEVATFGTLKRVLEEILNITELSHDETEKLKDLFEWNLALFREAMAPVMAQIVPWRRKGERPHLNDIPPKEFFQFADGKISLKGEFRTASSRVQHAATCVKAKPAADDELAKAEAEFRERQGIEKYVRGKYLLWFFVECALEIHRVIPKFCVRHSTPPKVRLSLGPGNAMIVVAPRVRCPTSLQSFLEYNYSQYIR